MRKLVIDRSRWARKNAGGELLNGYSCLLNGNGGMCCLGFYCVQFCGLSEDDLLGQPQPSEIGVMDLLTHKLGSNDLESTLIRANDREDGEGRTDAEQEAEIARLFSLVEIEVSFIN